MQCPAPYTPLSRLLVSAAARAAALAPVAAVQQGASSLSLDDEAGPSSSAAGQAASGAEDAVKTYLTLYGEEEDCEAAQLAIQQELQVKHSMCPAQHVHEPCTASLK